MSAPTHIKFTVGGSSITIEPETITLAAAGGGQVVIDANVLAQSSAGSSMKLDANAATSASTGGSVNLTADVTASSKGGSVVKLDGNAAMTSSGNVVLDGATVAGTGKTEASLGAGGSSVALSPASADLAGPMVNVNGSGMVTIAGAMVKIG